MISNLCSILSLAASMPCSMPASATSIRSSSQNRPSILHSTVAVDLEEIKVAYKRLSKEYHPDTTSLPLKAISEKFLKLREIYNVLSNDESRRFYDRTLAEKMKIKLEDPHEQALKDYESVPDLVDWLGGRNLKLSDQAVTALLGQGTDL